jgi:hypothetical protein
MIAVLLGASGGALMGGCGSSTKTVSVAGSPPAPQATGAGAATAGTTATTPQTTTGGGEGGTAGNGGTPAPTSTRVAPEPAFTQPGALAGGLSAAEAVLRANGFTPTNTSDYLTNHALRVLVGGRTGSGDGYGQQAFFFVNGHYIGTDSTQPSATLRVIAQGDTEVTLAYPLYRKNDPLCCPGAGQAAVRFQLNNGKLVALNPIPPVSRANGPGRY